MSTQEALEKLCEKIGEVYNNDFPCICGKNPIAGHLLDTDEKKLEDILQVLNLLKENDHA